MVLTPKGIMVIITLCKTEGRTMHISKCICTVNSFPVMNVHDGSSLPGFVEV